MIFLTSLVALVLVLKLNFGRHWRRADWYVAWESRVKALTSNPLIQWGIIVILPGILVALVVYFAAKHLPLPWLLIPYLPLLLISLGPGDISEQVKRYRELSERGDNVAASQWVDTLRGGASLELSPEVRDWQALHLQALEIVAYRHFEQIFVVLFWFLVGGPALALVYRLSLMAAERSPVGDWSRRWLWLIEWPAVRLLGFSWALVGNFDTCAASLRRDCFNARCGSALVLTRSLRGALGVNDKDAVSDDGLVLINSALNLSTRALWLWLCLLAVVSLLLV
jgi:AmpE protein